MKLHLLLYRQNRMLLFDPTFCSLLSLLTYILYSRMFYNIHAKQLIVYYRAALYHLRQLLVSS